MASGKGKWQVAGGKWQVADGWVAGRLGGWAAGRRPTNLYGVGARDGDGSVLDVEVLVDDGKHACSTVGPGSGACVL